MDVAYTIILCISAFIFSLVGSAGCAYLRSQMSFNGEDQSSYENSKIASPFYYGGVAVLFPMIGFLVISGLNSGVLFSAFLLGLFSLLVDAARLSGFVRQVGQMLLVALAVTYIDGLLFKGLLPPIADKACIGAILYLFINIFRSMDQADEMSAMQVLTVGSAVIAVSLVNSTFSGGMAVDVLIMSACMIGFWVFNRYPSRVKLGNVGSAPIGLLLGFLLIQFALSGNHIASILLISYYIIDSSFSFILRLLSGKNPFARHRRFAYMRPIVSGKKTDSFVVSAVFIVNIIMVGISVSLLPYDKYELPALAFGITLSLMLYIYFMSFRVDWNANLAETEPAAPPANEVTEDNRAVYSPPVSQNPISASAKRVDDKKRNDKKDSFSESLDLL